MVQEFTAMRSSISEAWRHFRSRFRVNLAVSIGLVILGGVSTSAEEPPKKAIQRCRPAKTYKLPPAQSIDPDVVGPSNRAFIPNSSASDEDVDFQTEVADVLCQQAR